MRTFARCGLGIFGGLGMLGVMAAAACGQSTRPGMGAIPYADAAGTGTMFRVWAGSATSVSVAGEFNSWSSTANPLASESNGIWSADVPNAAHGQEYKFVLNGGTWKQDPRSVRVVSSATDANSILYDHSLFDWGGAENVIGGTDGNACIWRNDLVIYEMHVGSFNAEDWLPSTFDECIEKIPHLKTLGVSAIELMPISEFAGDRSWGYNPSALFAPESSFGGADGLKRFVKAAHEAGLAVMMDVVHNHYGPSDLTLWQFDGSGPNGGMYFYTDDRRYTDWGETRPNYGSANVQSFIHDHILGLVENYHIDGFRWDSVWNIAYTHYNGDTLNTEGVNLLNDINTDLANNHPNVFRIAEDHAFDGNMNFEAQWNHSFVNDIRALATAGGDSDRNMDALAYYLTSGSLQQVVYAESHDTCGDLNNKHRLPRDINYNEPQGYWAKKRAFLANAVALTAPGIPMLFMGSEYNEDWDFSNNHSLRWGDCAVSNAGIVRMYGDLIHLRRNSKGVTGGFRNMDNAQATVVNSTGKVVAVARGNDLLVVFNWSANAFAPYATMAFPAAGTWYCLYNSDDTAYDASFGGVGPAVNESIAVDSTKVAAVPLGAYSVQIWSRSRLPEDAVASFSPEAPQGCTNVAIAFDPKDGALAGAETVFAYIGANGWDNAVSVPMVRAAGGDVWSCDYDIPDDTATLRVCFHDGATNVWENNGGQNWSCAIANCGDMPSEVSTEPALPSDGTRVRLFYEVNSGPLTNRAAGSNVVAHIGRNGWNRVQDVRMTNTVGDLWACDYDIPLGVAYLTVCFFDGGSVWDSNGGSNWRITVSIADDTPVPGFDITNPATSPVTVESNTVTQTLSGTASNMVGGILWTNPASGRAGSFTPGETWMAADIPLAIGTNVITLTALNPNHGAFDDDYSSFRDGDNGGVGFRAWEIVTPATNGGTFASVADGWGMWANSSALVEGSRPFRTALQVGDTVSFGFQNGGIDDGGSVGFALYNEHEQKAMEYYFNGGANSYTLSAAALVTNTAAWTTNRQSVAFTLGTNWTYSLAVDERTYAGNLKVTSVNRLTRLRFWNYTAGSGNGNNLYITELAINGEPYLYPVLQRTLTVVVPGVADVFIETLAVRVTADGELIATLDAESGAALQDNIWVSTNLLTTADGGWDWERLPATRCVVSGTTVTVLGLDVPHAIYSIGKPGGGR